MYEITIIDTNTGEHSVLGVEAVGMRAIAALTRRAVEAEHEAMHGPVVADVMRFVTGAERLI